MTQDIDVGFVNKPEGLEKFLAEQGYVYVSEGKKGVRVYEHDKLGAPTLFYFPQYTPEENEEPDWSSQGIQSLVNINFSARDRSEVHDEAERIAKELVMKADGIMYDENLDDFFTKETM